VRASILEMFPLAEVPPAQPIESNLEKQADRLGRVHQSLIIKTPNPTKRATTVRPGEKYKRYRTEEDIPEKGRLLFKLAGKLDLNKVMSYSDWDSWRGWCVCQGTCAKDV
jgi:hypothetical protein